VHAEIRKSPAGKKKENKNKKDGRKVVNDKTPGFKIYENTKKKQWMRHKKLTKK